MVPNINFKRSLAMFRSVNVLRNISIVLAVVSFPVAADEAELSPLSKPITLSLRDAPTPVFFNALFSNTHLDVIVDRDVKGSVTGDFTGSIEDVMRHVSRTLSLNVELADQYVRVSLQRVIEQVPAVEDVVVALEPDPHSVKSKTIAPIQSPTLDPIVERLFLLNYANAVDTPLGESSGSVIPGVVSKLKRLLRSLAVDEIELATNDVQRVEKFDAGIVALPSLNAVMIKDFESRMSLYRDLIESIDQSAATSLVVLNTPVPSQLNTMGMWAR